MPRGPSIDFDRLGMALREELAIHGPSSAADLCAKLQVSQATFSRLVGRISGALVTTGAARSTRYALKRRGGAVTETLPLHQLTDSGRLERLGSITPIEPRGFVVRGEDPDLPSGFYEDLPWFLHDLRPSGFLGRQIPARYPELGAPDDIRRWSAEHCLAYLARHGHDTVGAWLVGEPGTYLKARERGPTVVDEAARITEYPRLAESALAGGPPGSLAAGEQPRFLTWKGPTPTAVLVKFSPPGNDEVATRVRDLLIVEHLAHAVLGRFGFPLTRSELLFGERRVFLEVVRFDRVALDGRRGTVSLEALDAEFVGSSGRWSQVIRSLAEMGMITESVHERVQWLELFGDLIANTDMHGGNLSFYARGTRILDLAPVYDMTSMLYAPDRNQLIERSFEPRPPRSDQILVWDDASTAALELWDRAGGDDRISAGFRKLAFRNRDRVAKWRELVARI